MKKKLIDSYKKFRGYIKHNKIIFSIHRHLTDKDYKLQYAKMKESQIKTSGEIKKEMDLYKSYWKVPADDYIRYGLFNKRLSTEKILDYIPMQIFYCKYLDKQFEKVNISYWDDKWNQYILMKEKGINIPDVIALIKDGYLVNLNNNLINLNDISLLMKENEKLFIKPSNGDCGNGIIVIKKIDNKIFYNNKEVHSIKELPIKKYLLYIVQKGLCQREDLSIINESSLNTLRTIVTYINKKPTIIAIILRIGRKGSNVDNSGQGGISIAVDLRTGEFSDYANREHGDGLFYRHPDTNYIFKGNGIKNWSKIKESIIDTISRIDSFNVIGWDLAIGQDGNVYAIEFNMGFGIEHAQITVGGLRRALNVYPD